MQEPFIGQVIMFGGTFAPLGWNFCDGSLLTISDNGPLFNLIGTIYGGDGVSTFAVPDLRGRMPVNQGMLNNGGLYNLGQLAGSETVTLSQGQLPAHTHQVLANSATGTSASTLNGFLAAQSNLLAYAASPNDIMNPNSITPVAGGQSHNNIMPSLVVNYIIALEGVYPPQN